MAKKAISLDRFLEGLFPVRGIDLSGQVSDQPGLTTRTGQNVRACDVLEMRERGGSRCGLSRFINEKVSGTNRIDHLNLIVDPTPLALAGTQNNPVPDGVPDPSTNNFKERVPEDTLVEDGGAGYSSSHRKFVLTITADDQIKAPGAVFTFQGTEFDADGLTVLDTISSVELSSAGQPASAPGGDYPIGVAAARGNVAFFGRVAYRYAWVRRNHEYRFRSHAIIESRQPQFSNLQVDPFRQKYDIVYVPGEMHVAPLGHWVFVSATATWTVGSLTFVLFDLATGTAGTPSDGERYREVSTSLTFDDAQQNENETWRVSCTFRDIIWSFFEVNFAPNGTATNHSIGPQQAFPVPYAGQEYSADCSVSCSGTFSDVVTRTYDCGTIQWTVNWIAEENP